MSKDNSGFTMIELLAAIVVLGILMGSAVPIVIGVMNDQKNETYIQDAIRLGSNTDYKMRSDNKIKIPARGGGCVVLSLDYMDNNAFGKAPYGGEYDKDASFVVASRNVSGKAEEYTYYVRLIEKLSSGGYRGINLRKIDSLYTENARDRFIENVGVGAVFALVDYKSNKSGLLNQLRSINNTICPKGIEAVYVRE